MAKNGSSGNGKASTQGTGTALGSNTVAGNVRDGYPVAVTSSMKSGNKSSTSAGSRGTYLAPAAGPGYRQVSAGFGGSANTNPGTSKLPMSSAPVANTTMKQGKGGGAKKGLGKGYL